MGRAVKHITSRDMQKETIVYKYVAAQWCTRGVRNGFRSWKHVSTFVSQLLRLFFICKMEYLWDRKFFRLIACPELFHAYFKTKVAPFLESHSFLIKL